MVKINKERTMKLILTLIFVALLSTGCETGGDAPDNPSGDSATVNTGNTNPPETAADANTGNTNPPETAADANTGNTNPPETAVDVNTGNTNTPKINPEENPGETTPPVTAKNAGWYLRTVATATAQDGTVYVHKTAGVFGQLTESTDKKDRHDIAAYGEGGAILQILFTPTDWGEKNGNYFSNYKQFDESNPYPRNVWKFKVRNARSVNLADADLRLDLVGPYAIISTEPKGYVQYKETLSKERSVLLDQLTLVDVDNHREYSYSELKNANLGMDGLHTRTFKWVVGTVKPEDFNP